MCDLLRGLVSFSFVYVFLLVYFFVGVFVWLIDWVFAILLYVLLLCVLKSLQKPLAANLCVFAVRVKGYFLPSASHLQSTICTSQKYHHIMPPPFLCFSKLMGWKPHHWGQSGKRWSLTGTHRTSLDFSYPYSSPVPLQYTSRVHKPCLLTFVQRTRSHEHKWQQKKFQPYIKAFHSKSGSALVPAAHRSSRNSLPWC